MQPGRTADHVLPTDHHPSVISNFFSMKDGVQPPQTQGSNGPAAASPAAPPPVGLPAADAEVATAAATAAAAPRPIATRLTSIFALGDTESRGGR